MKDEDEIVASYDVTSLFTEIPLDETINHILDQIYKEHKLPQIASRAIFKRLLERVTNGTVFSFNGELHKQVDGCSMGNPLSPTLANIFMCKLEEEVVTPHHLPFYDRYKDDCFTKRKTNAPENLPSKHQVHRGRKSLTTFWTPLSTIKRETSPPESTKNQVNYKYIGNRPSQKGRLSATLL